MLPSFQNNSFKYYYSLLFVIIFFIGRSIFLPFYGGIDGSWSLAIIMAHWYKLTFGIDFVFNYGPLGYLNTGMFPSFNALLFSIIIVFFIVFTQLQLIFRAFDLYPNQKIIVGILALLIFTPRHGIGEASYTLLIVQLFWSYRLIYYNTKQILSLIAIGSSCLLLFFVKLNLSFVAVLFFIIIILQALIKKCISVKTSIITLAIWCICLYLTSQLLHVNLWLYLKNGLTIIDTYQDGMSCFDINPILFLIFLGFEVVILILLFKFILDQKLIKIEPLILFILASTLFIRHKQAFTALHILNILDAFYFYPALIFLIISFAPKIKKTNLRLLIVVLVLQFFTINMIRADFNNYNLKKYLINSLPNTLQSNFNMEGLLNYLNPLDYAQATMTYPSILKNTLTKADSNNKVLQKKYGWNANTSFDIIPTEISHLFNDGLKYNPRPVIQSYQVTHKNLARLNFEKYNGTTAPDIVFANILNFREQHPFWREKLAYLSLKYNYELQDTTLLYNNHFVFQKKNNNPIKLKVVKVEKLKKLSEKIPIPSSKGPLYLRANIKYNFWGKLVRFFLQPPYLKAEVFYEDGSWHTHRISPPLLEDGILVSQRVNTSEEFLSFINNGKKVAVKEVMFRSVFNNFGMVPEFDVYFEQVEDSVK